MRKKEVSYSKKTIVRLIWTGILVAGVIILTMGAVCFAGRLSMKVKVGLLVFDCILFVVYFAEVYRDMYRPWCELEKIVHERKDRKTETLADANIAQRDLIKEIQEIIPHRHPFLLVDCVEELEPGGPRPAPDPAEHFQSDMNGLMEDLFATVTRDAGVPLRRLTQAERAEIVARLYEQGMFELRGAVQFTVEKLGCSQASVYRYIKNAKAAEE